MTNETMKDGERAAFEAWANKNGIDARRGPYKDSGYLYREGHVAWLAWQARALLATAPSERMSDAAREELSDEVLMRAIADTAGCGHPWASRALSNFRAARKAESAPK
jgi:hypothetical protein